MINQEIKIDGSVRKMNAIESSQIIATGQKLDADGNAYIELREPSFFQKLSQKFKNTFYGTPRNSTSGVGISRRGLFRLGGGLAVAGAIIATEKLPHTLADADKEMLNQPENPSLDTLPLSDINLGGEFRLKAENFSLTEEKMGELLGTFLTSQLTEFKHNSPVHLNRNRASFNIFDVKVELTYDRMADQPFHVEVNYPSRTDISQDFSTLLSQLERHFSIYLNDEEPGVKAEYFNRVGQSLATYRPQAEPQRSRLNLSTSQRVGPNSRVDLALEGTLLAMPDADSTMIETVFKGQDHHFDVTTDIVYDIEEDVFTLQELDATLSTTDYPANNLEQIRVEVQYSRSAVGQGAENEILLQSRLHYLKENSDRSFSTVRSRQFIHLDTAENTVTVAQKY